MSLTIAPAQVDAFLAGLTDEQAYALLYDWQNVLARPDQIPPEGDWEIWMILSGRGWGKTRTGAEWVRHIVTNGMAGQVALIGETAADCRDVMVEGSSGILAVHPPHERPKYEPSKRKLTWPNGAIAHTYNAVEPDQLRGPQHDAAWSDELAKWKYARETWDQLQFGLRLGSPRQLITTTPRPIRLVKDIAAGREGRVHVVAGHTLDNRANLAPNFLERVMKRYSGTRLGQQELAGRILADAPNSLWTQGNIDQNRLRQVPPNIGRIVVSVDPPIKRPDVTESDEEGGAECGIVVCAASDDNELGYTLEDATVRASPRGWARRACSMVYHYKADAIVAEVNNGGAMVTDTIRSVDSNVRVIEVVATKGKHIRAEPVSSLYEQDRISHVGTFPELEEQMTSMTSLGYLGDGSPDRCDALVWGFTELFEQITTAEEEVPRWNPVARV